MNGKRKAPTGVAAPMGETKPTSQLVREWIISRTERKFND